MKLQDEESTRFRAFLYFNLIYPLPELAPGCVKIRDQDRLHFNDPFDSSFEVSSFHINELGVVNLVRVSSSP